MSPADTIVLFDVPSFVKSPSRLAILHKALEITTAAVRLKQLLLKDQLRNAVVKAVHLKQYAETEAELTDAMEGLIKRQFKEASKSIKEDGSTKFDPRDWDDDLTNTALPILMKKAGEAAAAQMLLMGLDIAPRKKRKSEKASRATEWLLDLDDADIDTMALWPEVFTLPSGLTVDLGFATEWPDWMKAEISKQMKECFEQPFWAGINDTTAKGIQSHVLKGIEEGLSIREIREQMVGDGLDEYYHNRGINIARTESGNALNGARSAAMDRLSEEVPGLKTKKTWMSVLGTTTRDTHAHLDGVPADRDGMWYLGGVKVPWPGHWNLPCSERANCQCTLVQSWGMGDEAASELIEEYNQRLAAERRFRDFWTKGDLPGHPFRGNQHSGGGGLQANIAGMISHLETIFKGPGRAAAVNEVLTAAKFPEYLKGILDETPGVDEIRAVVDWSVRRGRIWEVA